jgi:hypothetical protein
VRPGEREGYGCVAVFAAECEALHGLFHARQMACRNPPQREMRFDRRLAP